MAFIAITPYSSFKNDTILIGVNCISGKNANKLPIIDPYECYDDMLKAARYCWNVSLEYCEHLGKLLNKIHGVSYGQLYWKALLLPWAVTCMEIMHDRYLRLCFVRNNYPNYAIEIPQVNVHKPLNKHGYDVHRMIHLHSYNIKLYSLLIEMMGLSANVKYLDIDIDEVKIVHEFSKNNISSLLRGCIKNLTKALSVSKSMVRDICIYRSIDYEKSLRLSLKDDGFSKQKLNRREIAFESTDDEFKNILYNIAKWMLPESFFEEYRDRNDTAKKYLQKKKIKTVHISNLFWGDDSFKFLISQMRENGGKIIGRQHGGGYGQCAFSSCEKVEREITDSFVSWGWTDKMASLAIPLPDPRLSRLLNAHQEKNKTVLFIGTHAPMYMLRYQGYWMPEFVYQKYYSMKRIFFQKLRERILKSIQYRLYPHEYGWEEKLRIKEILPDVCFDESSTALENLKTCSLVVIDHPSTSFLEALVMNVPTILFWNNEQSPMREEAVPFFRILTDAGLLYYSPEAAAQKVNNIWDDVQGWWQQPDVQKAKNDFCYQFARTSKNCNKEWRDFLRTLK